MGSWVFFFSSRRRHTRCLSDWSSDVCSSDLARRLVRFASEDVGNADPQALPLAVAAFQAYHQLGSPEGELAIAQACVYLATAPKSNAVYRGFDAAMDEVESSGSLPAPLVIRNAPTGLMKKLGYGAG